MKNSNVNRLHPLAAVLESLQTLKEFMMPIFLIILTQLFHTGGNTKALYWKLGAGTLIFVLAVVRGIFHWILFRYEFVDGQLKVVYGVFVKKKKMIPLERIQTVDTTQGILHQMFGVVRVQIQTAGGQKPEAVLTAVTQQQADWIKSRLRSVVQEARMESTSDTDSDTTYRLSFNSLFIVGLSSGSMGIAISFLLAIFTQLDEILPSAIDFEFWLTSSKLVYAVILLLVLAWMIGVVISILKFANFKITRKGDHLHITRGLLERKEVTIPLSRIQAIRIVEELLWQPFGYAAVHVETAGYGKRKGESTLLFPLMQRTQVQQFLEQMAPQYSEYVSLPMQPLPSRSIAGYMFKPFFFIACITVGVSVFTRWGLIGIPVCLAAACFGLWQHRSSGWQLQGGMLLMRLRSLNRTLVMVPRTRIQSFTMTQNPLQRRTSLARFKIVIASGTAVGTHYRLSGITVDESDLIRNWYRHRSSLLRVE